MCSLLTASLLLILISINELKANENNFDNNYDKKDESDDIKRPFYRLFDDLLFRSNNGNQRQELNYFRPFHSKYDNNHRINTMDVNNNIPGNSNFPMKRVIPMSGFPPKNMWSTAQNGFGFDTHMNSAHMNPFHSNQMLNHLMPQTFNFMNTLRAGLKTGIPSYGFGYGIINDGFFGANNGFPLNLPFRSSFSEQYNEEKPFPESRLSAQKISPPKV